MKIYITLFAMIIHQIFAGCSSQKTKERKNSHPVTQNMQKIKKIEITEQSRGTNKTITFTQDSVLTTSNGIRTTSTMPTKEWDTILKQINTIDLSKMKSFEAPTNERFSDRASACTIIIYAEGLTFSSKSFDKGFPPKELENLYVLIYPKSGVAKKPNKGFN
ncbi:hypothetical protein [uncultured Chryseobacterium sp.]|uniref:hypothetical protein n=1 Tax=uncultured Chryseobacterium sp. TaxID=259322 RepID=UPI0025F102DE|nr:hypothetical protein [uncultured Chryseobacterium sp.]